MKLTKKQNEYIRNATKRWNLKIGAVRSGKTFVDIAYMIPARIRKVLDQPGLAVILGVSRESIERNVLQPMREIYTSELIGTINGRNYARICGQDVYCLGAEKISQVAKIQGSSIKYCYGDEIAKWNRDVFEMLKSRLDKPYSCFDGACNPESPNHWLKQFIDSDDLNAYIQEYTIDDNPFLPTQFVADLKREYSGTVYYNRYILGQWTLAEGLIYPMYEDAIGEIEGEPSQYIVSIDYGTQNAFAALLWAKFDKIWIAVDEYYYSGRDTGVQKTDDEYADDIDEWLKGIIVSRIIIDPSAASFIAELRKRKYKVQQAINDVNDGLRETAVAMRRGLIKISPKCKNWKNEAQGYIWDDDETPLKIDDHAMDAMRYFVKTMHLIKEKKEYHSIYGGIYR